MVVDNPEEDIFFEDATAFAENPYTKSRETTELMSAAAESVIERLAHAAEQLEALETGRPLQTAECVDLVHLTLCIPQILPEINQVIPGDPGGEPYEVTIDDMGKMRRVIAFGPTENTQLIKLIDGGYWQDRRAALEAADRFKTRIDAINNATAADQCLYTSERQWSGSAAQLVVVKALEGEEMRVEDRRIAKRAAESLPQIGSMALSAPIRNLYSSVFENRAYTEMIHYRFGNWSVHYESWYADDVAFTEFLRRVIRSEMDQFEDLWEGLSEQVEQIVQKKANTRRKP